MKSRVIQITALVTAIPLCLLICKHDLWAEPEPDKVNPAFYVFISEKAEENEIELEVETLKEDPFDQELELLAKVIEAEAGNQSLLGKKLVCDVILNRVQSEAFPDGITNVVNQPGQFACIDNGMADKAVPSTETWEAVYAELENRVDEEVIYFKTGGYSKYGEPFEKVGDHYFSK